MAEPPPSPKPPPEDIARQLDRTAADLRTLAEQLGAVRPGAPATVSRQRAAVTFAVVVVLAMLAAWFIWDHWHSLLAATAPLIWILGHGRRLHRRSSPNDEKP